MPLPPLEVQRELVAKVSKQRHQIAALSSEANQKTEEARARVEAMIIGEIPVGGVQHVRQNTSQLKATMPTAFLVIFKSLEDSPCCRTWPLFQSPFRCHPH